MKPRFPRNRDADPANDLRDLLIVAGVILLIVLAAIIGRG